MQTTDQVAGEARQTLASKIAHSNAWAKAGGFTHATVLLTDADATLIIEALAAALCAQPERGAEEMAVKAFQERALEGILNLRHAAACNFSPEYSGAAGEARCDSFLEAYKVIRALPLHPDKDEGGGHG